MTPQTAWLVTAIAVGVAMLATSLWFSWTANRLDRVHLRCEAARARLERQLIRRAALSSEIAVAGMSDPASAVILLEAAGHARDSLDSAGWLSESQLTDVLHVLTLPDPDVQPAVRDLTEATLTVSMARRIHNDLVSSALSLRRRRRVRWFRLAGHAPPPVMIEFDDRPL